MHGLGAESESGAIISEPNVTGPKKVLDPNLLHFSLFPKPVYEEFNATILP
jgi:hypothetical protein